MCFPHTKVWKLERFKKSVFNYGDRLLIKCYFKMLVTYVTNVVKNRIIFYYSEMFLHVKARFTLAIFIELLWVSNYE